MPALGTGLELPVGLAFLVAGELEGAPNKPPAKAPPMAGPVGDGSACVPGPAGFGLAEAAAGEEVVTAEVWDVGIVGGLVAAPAVPAGPPAVPPALPISAGPQRASTATGLTYAATLGALHKQRTE